MSDAARQDGDPPLNDACVGRTDDGRGRRPYPSRNGAVHSSPTIFVVEDDHTLRQLLLTLLAEQGYQVRSATNGADALAQLAVAPVDLILCDFVMPDMNGVEFLHQCRQTLPPPYAPGILMTAAAPSSP